MKYGQNIGLIKKNVPQNQIRMERYTLFSQQKLIIIILIHKWKNVHQ